MAKGEPRRSTLQQNRTKARRGIIYSRAIASCTTYCTSTKTDGCCSCCSCCSCCCHINSSPKFESVATGQAGSTNSGAEEYLTKKKSKTEATMTVLQTNAEGVDRHTTSRNLAVLQVPDSLVGTQTKEPVDQHTTHASLRCFM